MTHQTTMFDVVNHDGHVSYVARATDPATSKKAAEAVGPKLQGLRQEFMRRLKARGGPSTANEVAQGSESIRKRAKEILDMTDSPLTTAGVKRCEVTGQNATAYWVKG